MKRGAVRTKSSELVALWVPRTLVSGLDLAVRAEDSDRSKFIRNAIRERIKIVVGVTLPADDPSTTTN